MRYIYLVLVPAVCVLFSGCMSGQHNAGPVSPSDASSFASYPEERKMKSPADLSPAAAKTDIDTLPSPAGQENIDQALDLCSQAQALWKKGDLDQALAALDNAYSLILELPVHGESGLEQQKEDVRFLISKRILEIYASRQISVTGQHDAIPVILNDHVKAEIKLLTGREKKFFTRALERSYRYRPYIVEALRKEGLPEEISWLPLIESGFKIKALSSARALGLWQFIPSTGHKFGLSRNRYIDERMDPEKATKAAIDYLKELHGLFGDWTTALAAYNCGEGRVLQLIRRQKINYLDNFWDLYQQLPLETARYVPRFLATVHIIRNLEKYHISVETPLAPIPSETITVNKRLRLSDISRTTGIPLSVLKELNPELRHATLPPEPYRLKVPEKRAEDFLQAIASLKPTSYEPGPSYIYHRVRRGETLSGISRRYKTSVRAIARANGISPAGKIYVGKLLKVPARYRNSTAVPKVPSVAVGNQKIQYRVKKGDNLWAIARKMSTTPKKIMEENHLSDTGIHLGQILTISVPGTGAPSTRVYRVQSGDSPFLIAKKHNMTLGRLLSLNRLNKRSKIYPGQSLMVE